MTIDDKSSVYVGGLPYEVTEESLRRSFLPYGEIVAVKIINDRGTRGKCYGFVTFEDPRSAIDAIEDMDGRTIGDRVVRVNGVKTRFERLDFDRDGIQREAESGRDRDRRRERDYDHDHERFRERSDERLRERGRSRDYDSENERERERDRHVRNHDRSRDSFFENARDRDVDLENHDRSRNRRNDHEIDSDRDREADWDEGHGRYIETNGKRRSRKWNGSVTNDGQSREILSNPKDHSDEQVENELQRSTQRLGDLKNEVMQLENGVEHNGNLVLELQQKSKKLEDLLITAKKASSYHKAQLNKLHKCFLQVKDYTQKLKSSEEELQNLVEEAVQQYIDDAALLD